MLYFYRLPAFPPSVECAPFHLGQEADVCLLSSMESFFAYVGMWD